MAQDKPFSCPECSVEFKTQDELDRHKRTLHQKQTGSQPQGQQPPQKRTA
jgi:uncharacterized Zn-finger protein